MKKRLSMLLGAIAMLATGAASLGCLWLLIEEPLSLDVFKD